jgi:hypothetical protein
MSGGRELNACCREDNEEEEGGRGGAPLPPVEEGAARSWKPGRRRSPRPLFLVALDLFLLIGSSDVLRSSSRRASKACCPRDTNFFGIFNVLKNR